MDVDPTDSRPTSQSLENANKCKRINTAGDAEPGNQSLLNPTSDLPSGVSGGSVPGTPADWASLMANPALVKPTPAVLRKFTEFYNSALNQYSNALRSQTKRVQAGDRFQESLRKGETPPSVSESLRGPSFTIPPGLVDAETDAAFVAAREAFLTSLAESKRLAIEFMTAGHAAVKTAGDLTKLAQVKMEDLNVDLVGYANEVLTAADAPNHNLWSRFIEAVVKALGERMANLRIDFATQERNRLEESACKNALLAVAAAEAETKTANRSVDELVREQIGSYFKSPAYVEAQRKEYEKFFASGAGGKSDSAGKKTKANSQAVSNAGASTSQSGANANANPAASSTSQTKKKKKNGKGGGNVGGEGGSKAQDKLL